MPSDVPSSHSGAAADPLLVEVTRGDQVESRHRAALAVVDTEGAVVLSAGDYQRPVYERMRFSNVRIPMGINGLFKECLFVGVTFIDTEPDCVHENWNYAGALEKVESPPNSGNYIYEPKYPGVTAEHMDDGMPVPDTKLVSNNIRFESCTFIGSIAGVKPDEYTHWRNKIQLTGETRFYVDADDPDLFDQPDAADIIDEITAMDEPFLEELRKSSILMPGWSAGFSTRLSPESSIIASLSVLVSAT